MALREQTARRRELSDPDLPTLPLALDREEVKRAFKHRLPRLAGPGGIVRIRGIRLVRHKPGRRSVIEYDVRLDRPDRPRERVVLIGKIRGGRFGAEGYRRLDSFWGAGFATTSEDGVSVPEPIAHIPGLHMWLQRKAPGRVATDLLPGPEGEAVARRAVEALHKLHRAGVPAPKTHTLANELTVLRDVLERVAVAEPSRQPRVHRLLRACERLAARLSAPAHCGIHRDFYADQVLLHGQRVWLLDFDLYSRGDPALDLGNFLGHITEQALRTLGDPGGLTHVEQAAEDRFLRLSPSTTRASTVVYSLLTLARHVGLSRDFPDRRELTPALLDLCEERLAGEIPLGLVPR